MYRLWTSRSPRGISPRLIVLLVGVVAVFMALTGWSVWNERKLAITQSNLAAASVASATAEYVEHAFDTVLGELGVVERVVADRGGVSGFSGDELAQWLNSRRARIQVLHSLSLHDTAGEMVASSSSVAAIASAEMADLRRRLDADASAAFVIGLPHNLAALQGTAQGAAPGIIPVACALRNGAGKIRGFAVAGIDATKLGRHVQSLVPDGSSFSLLREDGRVLLQQLTATDNSPSLGVDVSSETDYAALLADRSWRKTQIRTQLGGVQQLLVLRRAETLPLLVSVNTPIRVVLADWRWDSTKRIGAATGMLLLILVLFELLLRQLQRLERSESRFQSLFRHNPVPTAILTLGEGVVQDANSTFLELIGCSRDEMLGRTSLALGFWDSEQARNAALPMLSPAGTIHQREAVFVKKSGEQVLLLHQAQLIELDGEKRVLLVVQDITRRHESEAQLQRTSERLLLATQSAGMGIWDWDVVNAVLHWDDGMYRLYRAESDHTVPTTELWLKMLHPQDRQWAVDYSMRVLKSSEHYDSEFRIVWPGGQVRYIKAYGKVQRGANGRVVRVTGINLDVSEQREAQERIGRSEAFLSAMINNTHDGIVAVDRELRIVMMNESIRRAARDNLGLNVKPGDEVFCLAPSWRREELESIFVQVFKGEQLRTESVIPRPGRTPIYLDESYNPVFGEGEQVTGISVFLRDVSERRHTENVVQAVVKGTSEAVGEAFFRSLVVELASALQMRCAFVGELIPGNPDWMRTIAVCDQGSIEPNFEFEIDGTLSAEIISRGQAFHVSGVSDTFPEDGFLAHRQAQGCIGVALSLAAGRTLGVLVVVHDAPIKESALAGTVLNIFAGRGSAEIERLQVEQERQRTRSALQEREASLRLAQQVGKLGSWERDLSSERLRWSEETYRILGVDPASFEPTRESYFSLVHPEDRAKLERLSREMQAGRQTFYLDHRIYRADGAIRHVHVRAELVHDHSGKPVRLVGIIQDITERKRAEESLRASEHRFRQLVESTSVIPWTADARTLRFTYMGPQALKVLGYPADAWCQQGFWEASLHPDDRASAVETCRLALASSHDREVELRVRARDGRLVWMRYLVSAVEQGGLTSLQGYLFDITEERRAEEQLRLAAQVFESSGEAIVITDGARRILRVNPAFTSITGYSQQQAAGATPYDLSQGVRSSERDGDLWQQVEKTGYWQGEMWDRRASGEIYPQWLTVSVVRDASEPVNYIMIFSDVSERKEREERVRYLAHHDFLTDLPNRLLLNDRIAQAISYGERTRTQVACMFLDLDRFKNVNDSLGHSVGDKLLQEVARRLKGCMRASDTVSRQGGDEFVVLMPDVADPEDISRFAEKVMETIAKPYVIDEHELIATPSMGISVYPADGRDVETLLKHADAAMYHAKESGRNNYQFFTQDMNARALERLSLERSLRRALERNELLLHYQPQFDVSSGRIMGVEALIRWQHPEFGLTSPARFMAFAEESGLILPIGKWVLNEACRQLKAWQQCGLPPLRVAVNISALQFRQADFYDTVAAALRDTGLDPRHLELEVTESVIMHEGERVIAALNQLKEMGVELAIDDFGTGYSSLSYLKRFPIDRLKIDQSFVRDINLDRDDAAITSAIIALTRNLGLRTIAEGVETREQFEFLQQHGCDEVQGFYFSRPLDAQDCARKLLEHDPVPLRALA